MKTFKLFIALILLSISVFAQSPDEYIIRARWSLATDSLFAVGIDTFDLTTKIDINDRTLATKQYVINTTGAGNGWDSIPFNPANGYLVWWYAASRIDSTSIDNRYVQISDTTSIGLYYTQRQVDSMLSATGAKSVYSILLPYASTVAGRIALAVEGVDYPSGWILTADGLNIDIQHDLVRWATNVTVFAKTGSSRQQLFGTAAHNGVITPNGENIKIQSLATIPKEIVIYILFE